MFNSPLSGVDNKSGPHRVKRVMSCISLHHRYSLLGWFPNTHIPRMNPLTSLLVSLRMSSNPEVEKTIVWSRQQVRASHLTRTCSVSSLSPHHRHSLLSWFHSTHRRDELLDDPCRIFSDVCRFWTRSAHAPETTTSQSLRFKKNELEPNFWLQRLS